MRRFSNIVAIAFATTLLVSICSTQQTAITSVPSLIRYSGTLKDAQGAALSASTAVGVTFSIYKQQDGGAAVWMETQNVTPDAGGNYSVLLGSTTPAGLPTDLFSQEEQRWLGVQVQGQAEQPRVLLVSVPYAFKAHEAETLAGKSISDFVLAKDLNQSSPAAGSAAGSGSSSTQAASGNGNNKSSFKLAASAGPTNFSGSTSDQIVGVTQTGTGKAIVATSSTGDAIVASSSSTSTSNGVLGTISGPGVAVFGQAYSTSTQAYGVEGMSASNIGIGLLGFATAATGSTYGLKGYSSSTGGTGVRGLSTATTGVTYGVSGAVSSPNGTAMWGQATAATGGTGVWGQSQATAGAAMGVLATAASNVGIGIAATESSATGTTYGLNAAVQSPNGTAAWLQNTAGGPLILATTGPSGSPVTKFSVDGNGNVNALGTFTGSGAGLTGIQFSQLGGTLASSQFSGNYSNAVTLSNTSNVYYGNGSNLTGVVVGPGSPYDVQNGTVQQSGANFNISGNGSVGGTLLGNVINSTTSYQIGGNKVLSIGNGADNDSLFLGIGAGANAAGYSQNTFTGAYAGYSSTGSGNTFTGVYAGYSNTGSGNNFSGAFAGYSNTYASFNTFSGNQAGYSNTSGSSNSFYGDEAGRYNSTGGANTFSGYRAGFSNTTGAGDTFFGSDAGAPNTTGSYNTFIGVQAVTYNTTGNNNIYIGNVGASPGTESSTIRIGGDLGSGYGTQTAAYIARIYGSTSSSGVPVYINSDGLLGTVTSSRRFKEQIADMGDSTSHLFQLRPVTFFYNPQYDDGSHTLQYGLIAEEVAKVYPDLVAYDKDGQPYTVKYQYLAPMLLNELQKQHTVVAAQQDVIQTQQEQIQTQGQQIADLQERLSRLESLIAKK